MWWLRTYCLIDDLRETWSLHVWTLVTSRNPWMLVDSVVYLCFK